MKKIFTSILLVLSTVSFAQNQEDREAIKSMCGCFEITFDFAETFSYPKDTAHYAPSKVKHETALEWVEAIEDEPGKLSLQHLLLVGDQMVVKHWREDWEFEPTQLYDYNGFNDWKYKKMSREQVKGKWSQKVFEVDDKPRYEGVATWVHVDGRHFWQNTTNAPLPRREYTIRNDYNLTRRYNDIEIKKYGWVHNQDNDKIIKETNGNEYLLAREKGYNVYKRVEDSRCAFAQKWWKDNTALWQKVRNKWAAEFSKNKDLKLNNLLEGKPLYQHLFGLKPDATQAEVDAIIDRYIIH